MYVTENLFQLEMEQIFNRWSTKTLSIVVVKLALTVYAYNCG